MKVSLFYNYYVSKEVLYLVTAEEIIPNRIVRNGEVVLLYADEILVGINILNIRDYIKININGMICAISESLKHLITSVVGEKIAATLEFVGSEEKILRISEVISPSIYIVSDGKRAYSNLTYHLHDKVGVLDKDSFTKYGFKASTYILGNCDYLIEELIINEEIGNELFTIKEK